MFLHISNLVVCEPWAPPRFVSGLFPFFDKIFQFMRYKTRNTFKWLITELVFSFLHQTLAAIEWSRTEIFWCLPIYCQTLGRQHERINDNKRSQMSKWMLAKNEGAETMIMQCQKDWVSISSCVFESGAQTTCFNTHKVLSKEAIPELLLFHSWTVIS